MQPESVKPVSLDLAPAAGGGHAWLIAETFLSVQGEGKLTGVPSFFIRTSGCNLRCSWCDTPYASWNPEGRRRSFADLIAEVRASPARHVVLTGGEPMIAPDLAEFSRLLCDPPHAASSEASRHVFHLTIETAGTVPPPEGLRCDLMSISPKLSNSTPREGDPRDPSGAWRARHESRRLNPQAIAALIFAAHDFQLKFVVASDADLPEIDALLDDVRAVLGRSSRPREIAPADILLMPEGTVSPSRETQQSIVRTCIARGWRYCPRLHIEIFGNKRGT